MGCGYGASELALRRPRRRAVGRPRQCQTSGDPLGRRGWLLGTPLWSMDFTLDTLASGRRFRTLNVVDDFTPECVATEVGTLLYSPFRRA